MPSPKRIGILGASSHLVKRMLPALEGESDIILAAIASRDPSRASHVASQWGIPTVYTHYEDLIHDPSLDGVYISLPPALHAPWIARSLAEGKHVLCEKPLVLTSRELSPLLRLASRMQKVLMPGWMYRFHPQWTTLLDILSRNTIGHIRLIDIHISYESKDTTHIRYNPSLGGGALNDIGCYALSASQLLCRSLPHTVWCAGLRDPVSQVDVHTHGHLLYPDLQVTFTVSMEVYRFQKLTITGSTGRLEMEAPFNPPLDRPTHLTLSTPQTTQTLTFAPHNSYTSEWRAFAESIEHQKSPFSNEDLIRETILLETCHRSLKRGKPQTIA